MYRQTHRGKVVSTDRLIEQHEHQTQRGVLCTDRLTGEGYCVQTDSQRRSSVYK